MNGHDKLTTRSTRPVPLIDNVVQETHWFETADSWTEWFRSLDPITAIKIGSTLTNGTTIRQLASVIDEITYAQTIAGGGKMTQAELAETIGISLAAVARRAGRRLTTLRDDRG